MEHFALRCIWFACLVVTLIGCNGNDRLDVAPVRGKVIYNGQGVPRATVIFHPMDDIEDAAKKLRPFAYAGDDGQFQLKTYVDGDGAPPGKYRVTIIAVSRVSAASAGPTKDQPIDSQESSAGSGLAIPPQITKKYANVDTSGIEVTVREGENNLEPFVL